MNKRKKQKNQQRKKNKSPELHQQMQFPVGNIFDDFFEVKFQSVQQENSGNSPIDEF